MDIISSPRVPPMSVYTVLPKCFWFSQEDLDKWCDYRYAQMCAFVRKSDKNKDKAIMMLLWYINRFKVYLPDTNQIADIIYLSDFCAVSNVRAVGQQFDIDFLGKIDDDRTMMKVWMKHPGRIETYNIQLHLESLSKTLKTC